MALAWGARRMPQNAGMSPFVVADLTDERPSCYVEAGYVAVASGRRVLFVASKNSVIDTKVTTTI